MFQYFMNDILREYLDVIVVGIMDNIIIFHADPAKRVKYVRSILQGLQTNHLYATVRKSKFIKKYITFVGYIVLKNGGGIYIAQVCTIFVKGRSWCMVIGMGKAPMEAQFSKVDHV